MEYLIKNLASRILIERADNGVIVYDLGEDTKVSSKIVYEIYYKDGVLDFDNMGTMMMDIAELLKFPLAEPETNRELKFVIDKIDPEQPSLLDDEETTE